MKNETIMFLIGFFGGLFFGVILTLAWPGNAATVPHDLTKQESWAALEIWEGESE